MSRTVRNLMQSAPTLDPMTTGSEVYDLFSDDVDLLVCAVVEDGRPIGLVARNAFFLRMADTHGRALFAKRPVTFVMDKDPLIVESDHLLSSLSRHILTDRSSALFDGFIITRDGKYAGIGTGVGLMKILHTESEERNRKLVALAEQLGKARIEAMSANQAKTEFLATMSHEIRTPLNGVLGVAQLLMESGLSDDQRHLTETIQSSGEVLLHLLNDVLDLSKIDAGKMEISPADFNIRDLVKSIEDLWKPRAITKGLAYTVTLKDRAGDHLNGDIVRLKQILNNLIGNAIKFTRQGHVDVTISVSMLTPSRHMLRADVRDTGCGIPVEAQDKLFTAFTQADSATTREFAGTGLGLTICKRLVDLMGGTINFSSEAGSGSQFWFEAPLDVADSPSLSDPSSQAVSQSDTAQGSMPRILLAEDNVINQEVIRGFLKSRNWNCEIAEDGVQAVEAVKTGHYDVVLMDVQMPRMDGIQATQTIRSLPEPACQTPILGLTANAMREDSQRGLQAGMNGYATKPIQKDTFFAEIERLIEEGRQATSIQAMTKRVS